MKRVFFAVVVALLFSCSTDHSVNPATAQPSGSADITIKVGAVGALAKSADIALAKLYIMLSSPGQAAISDSFSLSGTASATIKKTYTNMASLLTWTLTAQSVDLRDSVVHSGATTFTVQPNQTASVSLSLSAKYSMLKANFFPIRDSVTECRLTVDSIAAVRDSVFAKQALFGDTIRLTYDYLTASAVGVQHSVRMDVSGIMWGIPYLLYTGQTIITTVSGQNQSYTVMLNWVGPSTPPPGEATITVTLGAVGTQTVNGVLTPSGVTVTDIDGNVYHEVTIGTQTWMVENLKTTKYNDGTAIPWITNNSEWAASDTPARCWYNDSISYKNPYGALYNWYAVNTGKLAPTSWHVPSDSEWEVLGNYLGGDSMAGGPLKEAGTVHWKSPNTGATNTTGFTALPGGSRDYLRAFNEIGGGGSWWSATAYDASFSWYRSIYCNAAYVSRSNFTNRDGFSVRCVKDQ